MRNDCAHESHDENGVCKCCKEHYSAEHDQHLLHRHIRAAKVDIKGKDFARLDELLAKDESEFTAADTEDLERLAPLLVDPAYQEHQAARIEAAPEKRH